MTIYVFVMAYLTNISVQETQIHKYDVHMFATECKQTLLALYFHKLTFCQDIFFVMYVYKTNISGLIITCISVSFDTHMQTIQLVTINFTSHVQFSQIMAEICKN